MDTHIMRTREIRIIYVDSHHLKHDGKGCPLKKGACPYFDEHKNDQGIAGMLMHDGSCPLKDKCPFYVAVKNGVPVDLSGEKCPLAKKCPYYAEVKTKGKLDDCPLEKDFLKDFAHGGHAHHGGSLDSHNAENCPYLKKQKGSQTKNCPLKDKCPYVGTHHVKHDGTGCPLQKGGCPYYKEHAEDANLADVLVEADGEGCPLKDSCPYYDAVKDGKKVDISGSDCPLAEKCPYYETIKENGVPADCPLEKSCPRNLLPSAPGSMLIIFFLVGLIDFKKDFEHGGHAHHAKGDEAKKWYFQLKLRSVAKLIMSSPYLGKSRNAHGGSGSAVDEEAEAEAEAESLGDHDEL
ncbi:hypothetical protein HDU83_001511 [Entophlyctis luteolus]|nr:hypothetical protein HDU83_001511 [Entophlyctis luteolus]